MTQSKLKKLAGPDYKKYFWFSHPTDNFGLGTMYETPADVTEINLDENYLCASTSCLALPDISGETSELKRLKLSGFAEVGAGAPITLSEKEQDNFKSSVALPAIFKILDGSNELAWSNSVSSSFALGKAYARTLVRPKMYDYLEGLSYTNRIKAAYTQGELSVAIADVVIDGFSVTLSITNQSNASLAATLDKVVGTIIGEGTGMSISVAKGLEGNYVFTASRPTIVAVLYKRLTPKAFAYADGHIPGNPFAIPAHPARADTDWSDFQIIQAGQTKVASKSHS
jgi:hypothetical protein